MIRIVFDFYPLKGGSITHTMESARKINDLLESQILIAPWHGKQRNLGDEELEFRVRRVGYSAALERAVKAGFPVLPMLLLSYLRNARPIIESSKKGANTIVNVQGTLLGAIASVIARRWIGDTPIVITQHSANPNKISFREKAAVKLSFVLMKVRKPDLMFVLDDGMGIDDFAIQLKSAGIGWIRINHAIDTDRFKPVERSPNRAFVVVSTSRLDPFKRVDYSIAGFAAFLSKAHPTSAELVIIGDGPEKASLERLVMDLGIPDKVTFRGELAIQNVLEELRKSDVAIATSLMSNLNLSIQEAMACGNAIVAFSSGETSKLIDHMRNGILVAPGDVDGLADSLSILYNQPDLRRILGVRAREKILVTRTWNDRLNQEIQGYEEVLGKQAV